MVSTEIKSTLVSSRYAKLIKYLSGEAGRNKMKCLLDQIKHCLVVGPTTRKMRTM